MNRRARYWRRLRWLLLPAAAIALLLCAERALDLFWPYPLQQLRALPVSTVVTAGDGTWLRVVPTRAGERVLRLGWDEAPAVLRAAVLGAEDQRFFAHGGVDSVAVLRALGTNLLRGRTVSGASTLTMQVVRIVEPRPRTIGSKLLEALRARQLERLLDKQEIASVWLTQVPMGGTLRGFEAAARCWFGCSARELDLASAAALVAMVPAPTARSPDRHPERLLRHRDLLLQRLGALGVVTASDCSAALLRPLSMRRRSFPWLAPHFCDAVLAATSPHDRKALLRTGLDLELQQRLQQFIAQQPPLPGDGLAVVVVEQASGAVRALLGDCDAAAPLDLSRCRRSAGSTLKPFLHALAFELGAAHEASLLDDSPLHYGSWRPANFDRGHLGRLRPGDALAISNNLVAVRCLAAVGPDAFGRLLQRLGLLGESAALHLDAALGSGAVTPLALASAYRRFVAEPLAVGLSPAAVEATLRAMQRLPPLPGQPPGSMLAWKSGTSSGCRDAWSVGITARHVIVVWLGNRDGRGAADLVGIRAANVLLAGIAGLLGEQG